MDQSDVISMVEDFWRSFIPVAFSGDQATATLIVERFDRQIGEMSLLMSEPERSEFLQNTERARETLFLEYEKSPTELKRRLQIPELSRDMELAAAQRSSRMGLGKLAVRSAVRATAWETVLSVFRVFRT